MRPASVNLTEPLVTHGTFILFTFCSVKLNSSSLLVALYSLNSSSTFPIPSFTFECLFLKPVLPVSLKSCLLLFESLPVSYHLFNAKVNKIFMVHSNIHYDTETGAFCIWSFGPPPSNNIKINALIFVSLVTASFLCFQRTSGFHGWAFRPSPLPFPSLTPDLTPTKAKL